MHVERAPQSTLDDANGSISSSVARMHHWSSLPVTLLLAGLGWWTSCDCQGPFCYLSATIQSTTQRWEPTRLSEPMAYRLLFVAPGDVPSRRLHALSTCRSSRRSGMRRWRVLFSFSPSTDRVLLQARHPDASRNGWSVCSIGLKVCDA